LNDDIAPLLLDRRQIAQLLGVSTQTIVRMQQAGTIRTVQLTGGESAKKFSPATDLEALIREHMPEAMGRFREAISNRSVEPEKHRRRPANRKGAGHARS
jgi:hypothetical protein